MMKEIRRNTHPEGSQQGILRSEPINSHAEENVVICAEEYRRKDQSGRSAVILSADDTTGRTSRSASRKG
jgi:hypothetical protein